MYKLLESLDLENGLTSQEADRRLKEQGPNALPESPPPSNLAIFIAQLKGPLVYVLLVAGGITLALRELTDSIIIFLAVFINTGLGYFQERKAGKALEALKKLLHPHVRVIRDGEIKTIEVATLVVGDIVLLHQGDKVPADGIIVEATRFFTSEAILTGESVPVEKKQEDKVFMGTVVTAGSAKVAILSTGADTEMGKIAKSVSEISEDTPLREQLKKFSKQLSVLVLGLTIFVFVVGLLLGENPTDIFTTSVALAVSAIPEGLLVALTVVLAIGMQRILARKGLVRNLVSAETLGGVTTICVDKTGTLTEGKMQVVNAIGDEIELALQALVANDMDDPVVVAAWEWGNGKIQDVKDLKKRHNRLDSLPFSSAVQFFACLTNWSKENNMLFVNGAPEVLMEYARLSEDEKVNLKRRIEELSMEGKRIIGMARKIVPFSKKNLEIHDVKSDLEWVGLLAFTDPVRPDVKDALRRTRDAGIGLMVITGDYANTALAVLHQLEIAVEPTDIILGTDLEKLSDEELGQRVKSGSVMLFARTKPDQKLKIVNLLKNNGEVVAMMGDGVNDAPALSQADIGIVVNEASDVAKESADLILLDSSFSTIVSAVEEGRGIFDNIRKVVLYLMSDAFVEIFVVVTSLVLRLPLPLTAAQILWVNLVSDGFPGLALTIDPKASGIMQRRPRSPEENLISLWMKKLIAIVSISGGIFAFALFVISYYASGKDAILARSVAFATVGFNSLIYVFSVRTLQDPFWKEKIFANRWLVFAVLIGIVMQVLPFAAPPFRNFFEVVSPGNYWFLVVLGSVLLFLVVEFMKWNFRHHLVRHGNTR